MGSFRFIRFAASYKGSKSTVNRGKTLSTLSSKCTANYHKSIATKGFATTSYNPSLGLRAPVVKMTKHVLIVFAHQEPEKSFNGALKNTAIDVFNAQGYNVQVSDLYAQNFDPRATKDCFKGPLKNSDNFKFAEEAAHAYLGGTLCEEVSKEIDKIKTADLIIIQTPMYYFSVPAILKGWFDKVLIGEFAFTMKNIFDNGLLRGKKVLLSVTTGSPGSLYTPFGMCGDINIILWPIMYGILRFTGMDVLKAHISHIGMSDEATLKKMLCRWSDRLDDVMAETPIHFVDQINFDSQLGLSLSQEFQEKEKKSDSAPSIGQHMNKKIENVLVYTS